MTYARREQIFSKEVITLDEFAELMDMDYSTASRTIVLIKDCIKRRNGKARITVRGKLHVQDYIDFYKVDMRRYIPQKEESEMRFSGMVAEFIEELAKLSAEYGSETPAAEVMKRIKG